MRIKLFRFLLQILAVGLLVSNTALAGFRTNIYCHVRGYFYYDGYDGSSLVRSDVCDALNVTTYHNKIIIWNEDHWVSLEINGEGFISFIYKWGNDSGLVNGVNVPIQWGFVARG